VGSVRLKQTAVPGILETGIWLIRHIRGQGVGRHAMIEMLQRAAALGALGVRADTTTSNRAALASCDISTSTWCPLMMVQGSRPS
jgi:RimJ/RimL family protein N-acetyltransferase